MPFLRLNGFLAGERAAEKDGTWAADADAVEMAGGDGTEVARAVEGLHAFQKEE